MRQNFRKVSGYDVSMAINPEQSSHRMAGISHVKHTTDYDLQIGRDLDRHVLVAAYVGRVPGRVLLVTSEGHVFMFPRVELSNRSV